jgi:hypothetical protein
MGSSEIPMFRVEYPEVQPYYALKKEESMNNREARGDSRSNLTPDRVFFSTSLLCPQ